MWRGRARMSAALRRELARTDVPTLDGSRPLRHALPASIPTTIEQNFEREAIRIQRMSMRLANRYHRDVSVEGGVPAGCYRFSVANGQLFTYRGVPRERFLVLAPYVSLVVNFEMAERLLVRDGDISQMESK